jgi:small subunit ribosomal protein S19e
VSVYDVNSHILIKKVAEKLKEMGIEKPKYVDLVKSGSHKERLPQQKDFWYIRLASILRNLYIHGNTGVGSLRLHYGGRKIRGVKPEKKRKASGSIIRRGLQALEKAGLVAKKKVGREITPAGQKLLDSVSKEIFKGG